MQKKHQTSTNSSFQLFNIYQTYIIYYIIELNKINISFVNIDFMLMRGRHIL